MIILQLSTETIGQKIATVTNENNDYNKNYNDNTYDNFRTKGK